MPQIITASRFRKTLILLSEAIAAIYRAVAVRFERNLTRLSALCADRIVHLACTVITVALTCVTACFATLRLVCKSLFSIKFLLAGSKSEFLSAIFADEGLVVVHNIPLKNTCGKLYTFHSTYMILHIQ